MGKNAHGRSLPMFTGGLILGFGVVVMIGLGILGLQRRTSGLAEASARLPVPRPAAPWILLKAPTNDAQFLAPADVELEAEVGDTSGPVTVEFYHGPIRIGEAWRAPYRCTWKGLRYPGNYQLTAKLILAPGVEIESSRVWIRIDRDPPALSR